MACGEDVNKALNRKEAIQWDNGTLRHIILKVAFYYL